MREACIRAVANALGKEPTQAQLRNIEVRIQGAMLRGARDNPEAWRALTPTERLTEAGKRAALELSQEAAKQEQRGEATVLAHDRIANYRATQVANGNDQNGVYALERTLIHKYDEKNDGFRSVEETSNATFDFSMSQIADIFETVNPGLWQRVQRGVWRMEPLRRAFVEALHGKTENVPREIVQAAERYHEISNALREQFNAAGGVVGKLEDWGMPHTWSARLLERVGPERFAEDMLGWVNKRRYVHEDGRFYSDEEIRAFFREAYKTIVSDGVTSAPDGLPFPGGAVKANRGSQHRVIHLRSDAAYGALTRYSEQNVLEAMVGGLRRMSRDVALVETFGPNADYQFHLQLDKALREAAEIDSALGRTLRAKVLQLNALYDTLAGNNPLPANRPLHDAFTTSRNLLIASKLGSAVITSISDFATLYQTAFLHRLNPLKVALNSSLAWAPKSRRFARRMGLVMETVLADMERYSAENLTSRDMSSRTASAVIRASGLGFVTNARRLGFSMTMMDSIGHLTRRYESFAKLAAGDRRILASKGINEQTWAIWRAARLDNWGANHTLLTPENIMAIPDAEIAQIAGISRSLEGGGNMPASEAQRLLFEARRSAVIDLLAIVRSEQDIAVITPGARERAGMDQQLVKGTWRGEIGRSVFLFKGFPWAFMQRHIERGWDMTGKPVDRVAYLASLTLFMTMGGAVANWINDLLNGRNPRNMNVLSDDPEQSSRARRQWVNAALKGGGVGVYGDFLFAQTNPYSGNSFSETMAGPLGGTVSQAQRLTGGNAIEALQGDETHFGSEAVRFAHDLTPGANLWFIKGLADRTVWNQLMEMTDPGAVDRLRERQQRTQGTTYYWNPRELTPDRPPDLSTGTRPN